MTGLFFGPSVPPVNGFALITDAMRRKLSREFRLVVFFASGAAARVLFSCLKAVLYILLRRPAFVYVALSGGRRQIFDLIVLLAARLLGIKTVVHHHSFAYIDRPSKLAAFCVHGGLRQIQIVLCGCMGSKLRAAYRLDEDALIFPLSNSAFLGESNAQPVVLGRERATESLVLGFLSNITRDKGIFEFLDIVRTLLSEGSAVSALIAGPVSADIREEFELAVGDVAAVTYIGPVYESSKVEFFNRIDLLVFPSLYKNEAEPVTIWEALSNGVGVVAYARGCIGEMLSRADRCSAIVPSDLPSADRILRAGVCIRALSTGQDFAMMKSSARTHFEKSRGAALRVLAEIFEELRR